MTDSRLLTISYATMPAYLAALVLDNKIYRAVIQRLTTIFICFLVV